MDCGWRDENPDDVSNEAVTGYENGCSHEVSEEGEYCQDCEEELQRVAKEDDAFDHRMGLDNED